ncbi:class I SAM-dependent methyltransferase [Lichenicoccus roseus]|uniref:Class I SAM-dependent methyltransferase n=1 Tax=Lichenicoccus roseus TaxID=2683649 RepID=A0A5R9IYN3_9PROT|nr:class I SAM-dependent methyltransferase [Lichenicoccus roseus]TLU70590.1 class I SAM-dependent methyltransferase [Lichenicoccus roseus]
MSQLAKAFWDTTYKTPKPIVLPDDIGRAVSYANDFLGPLPGKQVLDIGCGDGATSLFLARRGAIVTAIDYSAPAIENLQSAAEHEGLHGFRAVVGDVMQIDQLGQFDYVFGSLILHHLEPFHEFCGVLRRTLKKGGSAFFYENNASSDLLIWFRRNIVGRYGVPRYGDEDEFPLMPSEIDCLRQFFQVEVKIPEMVMAKLVSAYLLKRRFKKTADWIDAVLFASNIGTRHSYRQYVMLRG